MSADQSTDASPPSSAPAAATSVPVGADAEADAADTEYTDDSTSVCSGSDADDADETAALPAMLDTLSPALSAAAQQLTHSTLCRIHRLAQVIRSGAYVVIVTGAGVSVASGIRTYRSGKDGLWNNYVYEWGTKRKFLSDPSGWYTNFWLKAHDPNEFLNAQPGPSHIAIAQIMKFVFSLSHLSFFVSTTSSHAHRMYPNVRLITQNVDRLHLKSGVDPKRLVEVHGAVGLYRCSKSFVPLHTRTHMPCLLKALTVQQQRQQNVCICTDTVPRERAARKGQGRQRDPATVPCVRLAGDAAGPPL